MAKNEIPINTVKGKKEPKKVRWKENNIGVEVHLKDMIDLS